MNLQESPSSRRAWIEIHPLGQGRWYFRVALLAEGVDRNLFLAGHSGMQKWSPSSRRAWIEMLV